MCGITGILSIKSGNPSYKEHVNTCTDALQHRGPDAHGYHINEDHGIYLGHRRLSIIDLNPRSNQPFRDHSGRYTMIFNGQVYNFKEIRAEIPEYPFHTTSDTEVIVAAYAKWGPACLGKMNGMFAIAIYDTLERTLFLARDRVGVKPLYYYKDDKILLFASEIRALLKTGLVPPKLDKRGVMEYLLYQSAQCPHSVVEGIRQLKPGHYALIRDGVMEEKAYWSFNSKVDVSISKAEALREVKALLSASVERRMISDVPLGAFLSGGIDSSAIVALMAQASDSAVETFSIVFNEPEYDESAYSDLIAKKYHTKHHKLLLSPQQFMDELPAALDAMDNPSSDGMNTYVVSKMARQAGLTVAMSGLGGDELFAGYRNFHVWNKLVSSGFFAMPLVLRSAVIGVLPSSGRKKERLRTLSRSGGVLSRAYPAFRQVIGYQEANTLMKEPLKIFHQNGEVHGTTGSGIISQYSIAELTHYTLNVLLKDTDQFSMASSLEVREPFFDHNLIEYVLCIPDRHKLGSTPKQLLVEAMGDLLPDEIVHRPKKGFSFPWNQWVRKDLRATIIENINYLAQREEFNGLQVMKLWTDFESMKTKEWAPVWQLACLGHWMRRNL